MQKLMEARAPESLRKHAKAWAKFCREYVEAKRILCRHIEAILRAHPDHPHQSLPKIEISERHVNETIVKLESMHFVEADLDIPHVPKESPSPSCCTPNSPVAPSKLEVPQTPSKIKVFLKREYNKILETLKYKIHKRFPPKEEIIKSMLYDIKELEYNLNVLGMQCDKLEGFYENHDVQAGILKRRTIALASTYAETHSCCERVIDCTSTDNKKLKKYIHDKLITGDYPKEAELQRSDNPVAGCSGEQYRLSAKTHVSRSPKKRFTRSSKASASPGVLQVKTPSKKTPKHSAKENPEGQPPSKRTPTHSSHMAEQVITLENRDDVTFTLPGDTSEESTENTVSTLVCDSVADMALTGSEHGGKKKAQSMSPRKTGTKPKKDLTETKELAKTRSASTSKDDSKKPKKLTKKAPKTPHGDDSSGE